MLFPVKSDSNNSAAYPGNCDFGQAVWIGETNSLPIVDSLFYEPHPTPLFRKEFFVGKKVKSATLCVTAAGYYRASMNGQRIGKNFLDPVWTNYSKRIYYSEYDVTSDIQIGMNCIGITLGNGFYNPLPLKIQGHRNLRDVLPIGKPVFISKLKISYTDETVDEIFTDSSWKHSHGPIIRNNVYLGEVYDARKEITGWDNVKFDDKSWLKSVEFEGTGGQLQKIFFPPIQISDSIKPISITEVKDGTYIIDMGVNFTGIYKVKLTGEYGDTVSFRFGERLYDDGSLNVMTSVCGQIKKKGKGGPGSPAIAWQTDQYIFGKQGVIWYSPEFTFHVYRYIEITGLKRKPECSDVVGLVLNTNVDKNSFSCSSPLINLIQEATVRTFLANLIGVQSDCPGRERFGYGGDLNATGEAFIYNFNMQAFYRKTIYDWVDAMNDSVFVDTAPYVGIRYCGLSWESAFLITQYNLLLYYNDLDIVKEMYPLDLKWMEKVSRIHPNGIVDKGLGDHESLEKVPVELTGTTHYLQCARIMQKFASLMHDRKNEEKFSNLAHYLQKQILTKFWNEPFKGTINKQTLFSTLLYFDVIPENERRAAVDSLFNTIAKEPSSHFTTGIFGTKYILEALSKEGYADTVFDIINSKLYPGWGFMIDRGATTIWETWKESDNIYSNCHPMFGSVSEWFYRWLGGIRPDPDYPGFEKFTIAPTLPQGLDSLYCEYESPTGKIISSWKKSDNKQIFEITVPAGSKALFKLPVKGETQTVVLFSEKRKQVFPFLKEIQHDFDIELKPGSYTIESQKNE